MDLGIKDKIAVVTGAGRGMGRAIAIRLANEGCRVVINDIDSNNAEKVVSEIREIGRNSMSVQADVSKQDEVEEMFSKIYADMKRVDILVNNAGVGGGVPFPESKREDWDRAISICLYGTIFCSRAVVQGMIDQRWGRVVSIMSDAGRVGEPNLTHYSAAKAGVLGFTKALAKEVGRHGITANCVSAGATRTDNILARNQQYIEKYGQEAFEERQRKILKRYAVKRMGEPEDIACAVAFLASDMSGYITGQCLSISGGYSMVS